jgi:hypothetical protein
MIHVAAGGGQDSSRRLGRAVATGDECHDEPLDGAPSALSDNHVYLPPTTRACSRLHAALSWVTSLRRCERGVLMTDTDGSDNRSTAYDQLCTSYHAIDDFRAKLLGLLPLVTGGGLTLLIGRTGEMRTEFFRPVGIFGILVTTGLLAYELNGIKRCRELIISGAALEEDMDLRHGQFLGRSKTAFSVITKPFAAALIYPAVLAAWTYLALFEDSRGRDISLGTFVAGFIWIVVYDLYLKYTPYEKFEDFLHALKQKTIRKL